jgi:hypothetical protein
VKESEEGKMTKYLSDGKMKWLGGCRIARRRLRYKYNKETVQT